jgi:prepilin-type N-terminal cleavage/methylation domain-containing protein
MRRSTFPAAFSLVELLVAMAILTLMLAALLALINGAIGTTLTGGKHIDADTEARTALDRMAYDVSKMVKRQDVDYYFQKNPSPGNDQMAFYSESSGYFTGVATPTTQGSTVSLVGYRINSTTLKLERLSKGLVWNGVAAPSGSSPMVFLPNLLTSTWNDIAGNGTDPDYQIIGDQVFRMELCYLVHDSFTDPVLSDTPYLPPAAGGATLTIAQQDALIAQDLVAIVVTVAVLDSRSRAQITPAQLQAAGADLVHVTGTTASGATSGIATLPAALWLGEVENHGLGLPTTVNGQVRIYQRYLYVDKTE